MSSSPCLYLGGGWSESESAPRLRGKGGRKRNPEPPSGPQQASPGSPAAPGAAAGLQHPGGAPREQSGLPAPPRRRPGGVLGLGVTAVRGPAPPRCPAALRVPRGGRGASGAALRRGVRAGGVERGRGARRARRCAGPWGGGPSGAAVSLAPLPRSGRREAAPSSACC